MWTAPPVWLNGVDDVPDELQRVHSSMNELRHMQHLHLNHDTDTCGVPRIDAISGDVKRTLVNCYKLIACIERQCTAQSMRNVDARLLRNIVTSLLMSAQQATDQMRIMQTIYLEKVRARDDAMQHTYETARSSRIGTNKWFAKRDYQLPPVAAHKRTCGELRQAQLLQRMTINELLMVKQREQDVMHIAHDTSQLNTLFKGACAQHVVKNHE
jgi:syntaxin 16